MKAEWTNKDVLTQSETTGQSKAVLVLDEMPKSCYSCPLTYIDYGDDAYYGANTTRCVIDKDTIPRHGKWDECPLKPLPQKKETDIETDLSSGDDYISGYKDGYKEGFNACLDAITGETE